MGNRAKSPGSNNVAAGTFLDEAAKAGEKTKPIIGQAAGNNGQSIKTEQCYIKQTPAFF